MLRPYRRWPDAECQPIVAQRGRHPGSLRRGACRGYEQMNPPREQSLDGFDPLARDLDVRLLGAERLALRVQRGGVTRERLQIGQPALGIGRRRRHHDEHPLRAPPGERGQEHGGARARKTGDAPAAPGAGERVRQRPCGRQRVEAIDQEGEGHQRVKVATASSAAATSSASTSSGPLASLLPAPANRAASRPAASRTSAPNWSRTRVAGAGVRYDSRGSGPDTIAPTVSAPRVRNSTPGSPSTSETGASPRTRRFTSASTNGTNAGVAGSAVHAVSSRLPRSKTLPSRTSHGSPFSVASTVVSLLIPRPASPVTVSIRYLRVTCTPLIPGTAGPAMTPGVPASAKRQRPPPAASARFTWPINAGSAGGTTTLTLVPACGRSPMTTSLPPSPPARTRFPSSSTASAAATNGPAPALGGAATRAGGATRHTSNRRSSARSSSASSTTSPTHQPGPSDGTVIDTVDPGVASARPTSRPRIRIVTGAAPPFRPAPGVPTMPTAAAPSVIRTVPTPRFGAAWLGGARASTRTPRGTAARPEPSAVRCRSLTTCTSRAGSGSASTRRVAAPTAAVRSSRRAETPTLSTVASNASLVPARATPSASTSQRRSDAVARTSEPRAIAFRRSSTGRPSTTSPDDGELSRITARAVGSCSDPPLARVGKSGRAAASTSSTINAVRKSRSSRCRSFKRRAFWRSASLRYRSGGNSASGGTRRSSKWSKAGIAAAASPTSANGCRNVTPAAAAPCRTACRSGCGGTQCRAAGTPCAMRRPPDARWPGRPVPARGAEPPGSPQIQDPGTALREGRRARPPPDPWCGARSPDGHDDAGSAVP